MAIPPIPRTRSVQEVLRDHLASANPPAAVLFIDGEELMVVPEGKVVGGQMLEEAKRQFPGWRELALMVYNRRHAGYLRSVYTTR